jgi:hypothetical protein
MRTPFPNFQQDDGAIRGRDPPGLPQAVGKLGEPPVPNYVFRGKMKLDEIAPNKFSIYNITKPLTSNIL